MEARPKLGWLRSRPSITNDGPAFLRPSPPPKKRSLQTEGQHQVPALNARSPSDPLNPHPHFRHHDHHDHRPQSAADINPPPQPPRPVPIKRRSKIPLQWISPPTSDCSDKDHAYAYQHGRQVSTITASTTEHQQATTTHSSPIPQVGLPSSFDICHHRQSSSSSRPITSFYNHLESDSHTEVLSNPPSSCSSSSSIQSHLCSIEDDSNQRHLPLVQGLTKIPSDACDAATSHDSHGNPGQDCHLPFACPSPQPSVSRLQVQHLGRPTPTRAPSIARSRTPSLLIRPTRLSSSNSSVGSSSSRLCPSAFNDHTSTTPVHHRLSTHQARFSDHTPTAASQPSFFHHRSASSAHHDQAHTEPIQLVHLDQSLADPFAASTYSLPFASPHPRNQIRFTGLGHGFPSRPPSQLITADRSHSRHVSNSSFARSPRSSSPPSFSHSSPSSKPDDRPPQASIRSMINVAPLKIIKKKASSSMMMTGTSIGQKFKRLSRQISTSSIRKDPATEFKKQISYPLEPRIESRNAFDGGNRSGEVESDRMYVMDELEQAERRLRTTIDASQLDPQHFPPIGLAEESNLNHGRKRMIGKKTSKTFGFRSSSESHQELEPKKKKLKKKMSFLRSTNRSTVQSRPIQGISQPATNSVSSLSSVPSVPSKPASLIIRQKLEVFEPISAPVPSSAPCLMAKRFIDDQKGHHAHVKTLVERFEEGLFPNPISPPPSSSSIDFIDAPSRTAHNSLEFQTIKRKMIESCLQHRDQAQRKLVGGGHRSRVSLNSVEWHNHPSTAANDGVNSHVNNGPSSSTQDARLYVRSTRASTGSESHCSGKSLFDRPLSTREVTSNQGSIRGSTDQASLCEEATCQAKRSSKILMLIPFPQPGRTESSQCSFSARQSISERTQPFMTTSSCLHSSIIKIPFPSFEDDEEYSHKVSLGKLEEEQKPTGPSNGPKSSQRERTRGNSHIVKEATPPRLSVQLDAFDGPSHHRDQSRTIDSRSFLKTRKFEDNEHEEGEQADQNATMLDESGGVDPMMLARTSVPSARRNLMDVGSLDVEESPTTSRWCKRTAFARKGHFPDSPGSSGSSPTRSNLVFKTGGWRSNDSRCGLRSRRSSSGTMNSQDTRQHCLGVKRCEGVGNKMFQSSCHLKNKKLARQSKTSLMTMATTLQESMMSDEAPDEDAQDLIQEEDEENEPSGMLETGAYWRRSHYRDDDDDHFAQHGVQLSESQCVSENEDVQSGGELIQLAGQSPPRSESCKVLPKLDHSISEQPVIARRLWHCSQGHLGPIPKVPANSNAGKQASTGSPGSTQSDNGGCLDHVLQRLVQVEVEWQKLCREIEMELHSSRTNWPDDERSVKALEEFIRPTTKEAILRFLNHSREIYKTEDIQNSNTHRPMPVGLTPPSQHPFDSKPITPQCVDTWSDRHQRDNSGLYVTPLRSAPIAIGEPVAPVVVTLPIPSAFVSPDLFATEPRKVRKSTMGNWTNPRKVREGSAQFGSWHSTTSSPIIAKIGGITRRRNRLVSENSDQGGMVKKTSRQGTPLKNVLMSSKKINIMGLETENETLRSVIEIKTGHEPSKKVVTLGDIASKSSTPIGAGWEAMSATPVTSRKAWKANVEGAGCLEVERNSQPAEIENGEEIGILVGDGEDSYRVREGFEKAPSMRRKRSKHNKLNMSDGFEEVVVGHTRFEHNRNQPGFLFR